VVDDQTAVTYGVDLPGLGYAWATTLTRSLENVPNGCAQVA